MRFALIDMGFVAAVKDDGTKLNFFEFNNAKMLWKDDFAAYQTAREEADIGGEGNNCRLAESDNFYGAQQCK